MPRKNDDHYRDLVEFVIEKCLMKSSKHASASALRHRLDQGEEEARREVRTALYEYCNKQTSPVRISAGMAVVLLGRDQKWIDRHKEELGHDPRLPPDKRYSFEKLCDVLNDSPPSPGIPCVFLIDGKEVIGTFMKVMAFETLTSAMNRGAQWRRMSIEAALLLPWRNQEEHRVWADAYLRVMTRQLDRVVGKHPTDGPRAE